MPLAIGIDQYTGSVLDAESVLPNWCRVTLPSEGCPPSLPFAMGDPVCYHQFSLGLQDPLSLLHGKSPTINLIAPHPGPLGLSLTLPLEATGDTVFLPLAIGGPA